MNSEAFLAGLGDVLRDMRADFSARLNQADERTKEVLTELLSTLKGVQERHSAAIVALGEQIDVVREDPTTGEEIEQLRGALEGLRAAIVNLAEKAVASDLQVENAGRLIDDTVLKLSEQNSAIEILQGRVEQDLDALVEELAQARAREKSVEKRVVDLERDLETVSAGAYARVDDVAQEARSAAAVLEERIEHHTQIQEDNVERRVGDLERDLEAVSIGTHSQMEDVAQEARAAVAVLEQKQENLLERLVELTGLQDRAVEERWELKEDLAAEIAGLNRSLVEVREELNEARTKVGEHFEEVKSHIEEASTKTSAMVADILARADDQDDRIAQAEQTIAEKFQRAIEVNGHGWSSAQTYAADISYPWKTIVKHRGGLWQSARDTGEEPGKSEDWVLLVEGIDDIQLRLVDPATGAVVIEVVRTSGERLRQELTWPQPQYLGTWSKDKEYGLYDSVIEGGHRWLAVTPNPTGQPSKNRDHWILTGMRGPAGRKGAAGPVGPRGPVGPAGASPEIEKIIEVWMQTVQETGGTPIQTFRGLWEYGAQARRGEVFAFKTNLYLSLKDQTCDMPPDTPGGMDGWIAMLFQTGGGGGSGGGGGCGGSVVLVTEDRTLTAGDAGTEFAVNSAGAVNLTLDSGLSVGWCVFVTRLGSGAVTVTPDPADQINGGGAGAPISVDQQYQYLRVQRYY